jgi:hypothetical protein
LNKKPDCKKFCLIEWQALTEPITQQTNARPTGIRQTLAHDMQRRKIIVPVFAVQKMLDA